MRAAARRGLRALPFRKSILPTTRAVHLPDDLNQGQVSRRGQVAGVSSRAGAAPVASHQAAGQAHERHRHDVAFVPGRRRRRRWRQRGEGLGGRGSRRGRRSNRRARLFPRGRRTVSIGAPEVFLSTPVVLFRSAKGLEARSGVTLLFIGVAEPEVSVEQCADIAQGRAVVLQETARATAEWRPQSGAQGTASCGVAGPPSGTLHGLAATHVSGRGLAKRDTNG